MQPAVAFDQQDDLNIDDHPHPHLDDDGTPLHVTGQGLTQLVHCLDPESIPGYQIFCIEHNHFTLHLIGQSQNLISHVHPATDDPPVPSVESVNLCFPLSGSHFCHLAPTSSIAVILLLRAEQKKTINKFDKCL